MTQRRVALLALMLALRALVPVGFMPVIDHTGIHIDFCPGEAQPPGALHGVPGAGQVAHHHQHGAAEHGSRGSASHPPCLFALSGSPAFVSLAPAVAPLPPAAAALVPELTSRLSVPAILRAQTPRGPPFPA